METLNLDAVEQQQIIITVALNNSDGTPADLTQYACYAASVGQQDPYTRRAPRKEWAAAINNESSAYILTAPGLEMAAAPWRYSIYLKDRRLGLEWVICTGRITLTPRACGTDGISPAAYSVACEATPSGLVNVTLDATVGSITGTLEQVKASAALASSSAANAHADLEDARKAATSAAQAATTAAADAKTAAEAATRAEQAATDAPQACAPFVGQVQAAAVQAQQAATHAEEDANRASTAATTATEKAQVATDAAEAATTASSDLADARETAVQAATTAQAAQQTAQLASTTATTAAENAREYAEDAQQAKQAAATSETNAAAAAQQASASASAAAASAQSAQASAATAVSAKQDLETARDTATAAATTATDAATAAATSETNATAAATAAATAQAAAEAAQAQADTDARACAVYDQRVAANKAASDEAVATAQASATAAAGSATAAAAAAQSLMDEELMRMVDIAAEAYGLMELAGIDNNYYVSQIDPGTGRARLIMAASGLPRIAATILVANYNFNASGISYDAGPGWSRVLYLPKTTSIGANLNFYLFDSNKDCYFHAPALVYAKPEFNSTGIKKGKVIMSKETKFEYATDTSVMCWRCGKTIIWAPGTTFSKTKNANMMFQEFRSSELPDTFTFEAVEKGTNMFRNCSLIKLPASMELPSLTDGTGMLQGCTSLEIEDIVRVCLTINNLQALETPGTGPLGLPVSCKHNGETIDTQGYLNANHPDFLPTLASKGWTVTFA